MSLQTDNNIFAGTQVVSWVEIRVRTIHSASGHQAKEA